MAQNENIVAIAADADAKLDCFHGPGLSDNFSQAFEFSGALEREQGRVAVLIQQFRGERFVSAANGLFQRFIHFYSLNGKRV